MRRDLSKISISALGFLGLSSPAREQDCGSGVDLSTVLNKLIFANLTHRPVRTLLSVLAIAVEVTMILTLVGVSYGTLDSTAARARGVGADIVMRPPNST